MSREIYGRKKRPTNPKMVRTGRKIVLTIGAVHIAVSLGGFFANLYAYYFFMIAFVIFALQIMLAVALIRGWTLARYLFAVNTTFLAISAGMAVFDEFFSWITLVRVPLFLYAAVAGALLFTSKDVCEYMYEMQEGW